MNAMHVFEIVLVLAIVITTALIARALQVSRQVQRGQFG